MQQYISALHALQSTGVIQEHITSLSINPRKAWFSQAQDVIDIQAFVKYRPGGLRWELTENLWYVSRHSININGQQYEVTLHNRS